MKNIIKKVMVGAVYFFTFGASIAIFAGNILYRMALGTKKKKQDKKENISGISTQQMQDRLWMKEHAKEVYITSEDGLKLHGFEISSGGERGPYVILCHGYKGRAEDMSADARTFHNHGYHILAVDARGHGESEGDYIGMGWKERRDIVDWCRRFVEKDENARIALYGVSMGAATVMMASGEEDLPKEVRAVVENCGYTSVWEEFKLQIRKLYHLPIFPFLYVARFITEIRAGYDFKEASAVLQVAKSRTPTLFIHGGADVFVPLQMLETLYSAASCEKEKLVIEEAEHAQAGLIGEEQYWTKVLEFIRKHMG